MSRFSFALLVLSTVLGGRTIGQVNEDFESGLITSWTQSPASRWAASSDRPISGTYSLKHNYDNAQTDDDYVGLTMNLSNIDEGSVRWRFLVKHGYAPSASNRWSVFLMSTANATQMNSGALFNGYSVGINTTGSDDKLRIYKHSFLISTMVTEVLLETNFNWETEVGTTKAAAIEVVRSATGDWTLRVAKDGLFANLVTLGTFQNSDFGTMQNFVAAYSYTSSADRNLWLDDISISYTPLNSNNRSSIAEPPATQVTTNQIFTTDTTENQAKELLRFKITDKGDGDGLPTKPTQLKFFRSTTEPDLTKTIGTLLLKSESATIPIKSTIITETSILLELDDGAIQVDDGAQKEFSLWATSPNPTIAIDHTTLGLEIPTNGHGWIAALSGSGFATTFPATVGTTHSIEVVASKVIISQQPLSIQKGKPFSITVNATDYNSNLDLDFTSTATLSLKDGAGNITIPNGISATIVNGSATWSNLSYSGSDNFTLKVSTASLGEAVTRPIKITNDSTSTIGLANVQPTVKELTPGCETTACAVELMRIVTTDIGGDGLPTLITQIKLTNAATNAAADWSKSIRFFAIKVKDREVSLGNPTITKTSATIPILPGDLMISDGNSAEIRILVGLNDKVTDGEVLQIKVDSTNHGFTTATSGSAFVATLPQALTSNAFSINIVATTLTWKKIPTVVAAGEPFDVEADAVDQFGNLDINYSSLSTLSFINSQTKSTSYTATATGGKAIFAGNSLSRSGEYRVTVSSGNISDAPTVTLLVGDKNSIITASTNTIPPAPLPSNSKGFIPILSVDIRDYGTTDTLPTIISKATISIAPDDTLAGFLPISKVIVRTADDNIIPTSTTISDQKVEITFTNGVTIANNSTENLIFYAIPNHFPVTDNTVFRFKIPPKDNGWTVSSNSTLLSQTQPYEILSPQFTTRVEAKMAQTQVKPIVAAVEPVTISAVAIDSLGNADLDYSENVEASIKNVSTGVKGNFSSSFTNGLARFNAVGTLPVGNYKGELISGNLPSSFFTFEVASTKACIVSENFESGAIPAFWSGVGDWKIDQTAEFGSQRSIRHNGLPEGKISTLTIPSEANLRTDSYSLSISLKNGSWAPSSDNHFSVILASNSNNLASDTISGYAIGVNQLGDDDTLKVWQLVKGKASKTLAYTDFVWKENTQATINLNLTPDGHRILSINGKAFEFTDTTLTTIKCFGLKFNYTSTRAGLLWADDISLCRFASGPKLISASRIGKKIAILKFSEPVVETTQLDTKVHLWNGQDEIAASSVVNENGALHFSANKDLPRRATLSWKDLTDGEGNSSSDSAAIDFGPAIEFGSIVFNEIMADPTPVVGLPEYEYVEFYSRSLDTLNLDGWTINTENSRATLHNIKLLPDHYLLLSTTTGASQPKLAENSAIGVTSFPSLTNTGATLTLMDPTGATVAQVTYSDDWYRDVIKKEGGFSLEKVDTENLSEDSLNWKASNGIEGGTPGRVNSVKATNPDITAPTLEGITVINETTVSLHFSEPLLPATISPEKFTVENSLGDVVYIKEAIPARQVELSFANKISINTIYYLTISSITDLAANSLATTTVPFAITELPKWQDVVINELLFNPFAGGADFIEIYNRAILPFNLSHLKLFRRDDSGALTSEIRLSNYDKLIVPGEYVAFTLSPENIKQLYHCAVPNNLIALNIPAMNDDQGTVVLTDSLDVRIDEVTYSDKMHYALLASTEGVSLERVNPEMPSDKASSWQSASQLSGFATPTAKNSCYREFEEVGSRVTIDPELFSPDGDGYHDVTYIRLKLPGAGWNATITIYDSKGREVRKLLSNALVDVDGEIVWDGLTNDNRLAEMGIYVVLVEMFHLSGETRKEKKIVVVGGRL